MMSPTIKLGDTVNAVRVDSITQDGLYVFINTVDQIETQWLKRVFLNSDGKIFLTKCDNPNYPDFEVSKKVINSYKIILRVFSLMITVDTI